MKASQKAAAVLITLGLAACGGGSSTTGVTNTTPGGTPQPTTTPTPTPAPTAAPPTAQSCPLGNGTLESQCSRRSGELQERIEDAIDRLVQRQPSLFNTADSPSNGVYRVLDADRYHQGVIAELSTMGFCANYDGFELQVKNTNSFSEQYDILTTDNFIRRGAGAYRSTCTPASFPVDPAEFIANVRVAFYGFRCQDGVAAPRNGAGELPIGCVGYVTATPKKRDGTDVDPRIHGPEITWIHRSGHEQIEVHEDNMTFSGFNRLVVPVRQGAFALCAQVRGVEGCLNGTVLP
jgi:hypothetical protein